MTTPLLMTKLYVPSVRPGMVPRPRLVERLNAGLHRKLTLVSAPAGFGKTTLLSEWANQRISKSASQRAGESATSTFAWLSLDEGDNDPTRFLAYFVAALQTIPGLSEANVGEAALAALQSPGFADATPPLSTDPLLTSLINEIAVTSDLPSASAERSLVLILDDFHVITDPQVNDAMAFLLDNLPPQMHLVLSSRADPSWPLARLRARGEMTELRADDLRFTPEETTAFLNEVMRLDLSPEDVAALETRTEGWIAGLQMAALSMRGREDASAFIRAFSGSHRFVLDYLLEEVLKQQPHDVQDFLLKTSILERMTAPLCNAVTESSDSQAILTQLDQTNLFLVPLDDERRWYRYHHLFADLLRQRLQQERRDLTPALHRRASEWYEENGLMAEAVIHALEANDYERAASLIEQIGWEMLTRGACTTLLGWIDAFPGDLVRSRSRLGVFRAWCLTVTGQIDSAEAYLSDLDVQQMQGEAAAIRAYAASIQGNPRRGIAFAQQALERLPEDDRFLRGFLALNLGIAYSSNGEPAAASRALNQAIELSRLTDQIDLTLAATAVLGHVQGHQARLRQAVQTHRKVLDLARDLAGRPAPVVGMAYLGIAEVLYEWNDLDGALHHVKEGLKLLNLGRFITYLLFGHSLRARICHVQGDLDGAWAAIRQAERLAQGGDFAYMEAVLSGLRARLSLAQGDAAAATRWAQARRWAGDEEVDHAREVEQVAVAQVLMAQDRSDEALSLLTRLLEAARTAGRKESIIRILTSQALAFQAQDNLGEALAALERALSLAEPEGYVRTFVDEGEPMARLLRQALSEGIAPNYAARLLAAFGEEAMLLSPAHQALIEPLTERELEVLRLVAAGMSNREIAQKLVIAVSTVKSHTNHIYGKLGVKNRTQAAARATTLDLL